MDQKHRTFIAINLPDNLKTKLADYKKKWPQLPVKWVKPNNLHITLAFLGYLNNEELLNVITAVKKAGKQCPSFSLSLNKISYGPLKEKPKMIWATGEATEELTNLWNKLNDSMAEFYLPERREFALHITLGRIRQWDFKRIEQEEIPQVDENINLKFPVDSIEVMESVLKRGGPEYIILESVSLSN